MQASQDLATGPGSAFASPSTVDGTGMHLGLAPALTAHGDRRRAEVFSACNGVAARLDQHACAVDGGEIGRGTTNVDRGVVGHDVVDAGTAPRDLAAQRGCEQIVDLIDTVG